MWGLSLSERSPCVIAGSNEDACKPCVAICILFTEICGQVLVWRGSDVMSLSLRHNVA